MGRAEALAAREKFKARAEPQLEVILVTGAPCSGKTTYVQRHMQPGDLVVDYDALAVALGAGDTHDHPKALYPFVLAARDTVLRQIAAEECKLRRAWVIRCDPTQADYDLASRVVALDTPADECKARARADGRPAKWPALIDAWHARRRISPGA